MDDPVEFGQFSVENRDSHQKLLDLCNEMGIADSELATKWEAYAMNNRLDLNLITAETTDVFVSHVKKAEERKRTPKQTASRKEKTPTSGKRQRSSNSAQTTPKKSPGGITPTIQLARKGKRKNEFQIYTADTFSEYMDTKEDDLDSGGEMDVDEKPKRQLDPDVIDIFNPIILNDKRLDILENRAIVKLFHPDRDKITATSRFLYDGVQAQNSKIRNRYDHMKRSIQKKYNIEVADFGGDHQEEMWVVGIVLASLEEGRIDPIGMVDENNALISIELNLSVMEASSLFPGQVAAFYGKRFNNILYVTKMETDASLPLYKAEDGDYELYKGMYEGAPISVVAACGPYTADNSMEYGILDSFLQKVKVLNPDVLIMMGPFVDEENDLVKNGSFVVDTVAKFREVLLKITYSISSSKTKLVLIPSTRDIDAHPTLPQVPIGLETSGEDEKYLSFPNPSSFLINNMMLGVTAEDITRFIGSCELHRGLGKNRIHRLTSHIVKQQSFCPIHPPPLDTPIGDSDLLRFKEYTPNIIISRSIMGGKPAHMCMNVLFVNPGSIARGENAGTFANILIAPPRESNNNVEKEVEVRIYKVKS